MRCIGSPLSSEKQQPPQLISGHLQGHKRFQIPYRPKSVFANKASEYSPLSLLCGHRKNPSSLKMYEINAGDRT